MPKAPITFREAFFTEIRGSGNPPLLKRLEFNHVETELGPMVEIVSMQEGFAGDPNKIANIDLTDAGINKFTMIQEEAFQASFTSGGNGWLLDQNI